MPAVATTLISAAAVASVVVWVRNLRMKSRREQMVRGLMFPPGVFEKFKQKYPDFDAKQVQLVARGLRQFFLAYLKSGCRRVAMPSQVVDDLWHEYILFTREYANFCRLAFGQFLHHTPAVKMSDARANNEGLRRVWWYCCIEENINPRKATRLPLLFVLDRKLGVSNGFYYDLDCRRVRAKEVETGAPASTQCATDFSDHGIDGSTQGLGDDRDAATDSSGADGPGHDGGGCGGGCGGD
jgi:hypothetical protein